MAVGTLSRDEIAAIFNSTEDYTQQANMAPYRPGLSREEIANFYNAPTASNTPAPAQPVSQPTQALPTLDPALAERERQMDEAKTIGRQALKYAQEGKLAQRDPAVSANEQRDIERAQKAQEEATKRRESARTAQTSVEPAERVNNEDVEVPTSPNARLAKRPRKGAQGIDMGPDVVEATETKEQKNKGTFKNNLTAEDQARVEEINKDIARLSAHRSQVNDRRISGLQAERDQLIGQTLSQGRNDQADTMAKWLDPDYKMTDSEVEQAKQIISDYENTEYKNANVVDLTADEQARQSQINALRDKVSKERGAEYGSLNATVNPLLTLGDRDYYGWSVDDLRSEVESKGDIALSPEVQEYVDQLKGEIDGLQNTLNNKGTVYSTGDAAVDEVIGANTNMTEGDVRRTLEEKEMQMYKLMLEASRGNDQPDYDSYSFRKQNAQKQNPAAYFAGDLATRAIESAAIQGAAGSNGFAADMLVDMATDTLPELSANKAAGMSDKEAWNQAGKNMLLNTLIDAGVWGLQNAGTIKSDFTNPPGGPPTLQPEVQPATVENLLKQNDVDINAKIDNVNNAVDEIKKLDEQIPDVPETTYDFSDEYKQLSERISNGERPTDTVETTLLNDPDVYSSHTPEQLKVMREYLDSTDEGLADFVRTARENKYANPNNGYVINKTDDKMAAAITDVLGKDTTGYDLVLQEKGLQHLDKGHGIKGSSDHSMADESTLARIKYVLDNYDGYEKGKGTGMYKQPVPGKPGYSENADTILFYKKVDGNYYVVEAAPDSAAKENYIVAAYTDSSKINGDKHLLDVQAPSGTSETGALKSPNSTINQMGDSVKGADSAKGEFTNPDSQKILDAYRAGERLSEADQDILEMALLEEKYGNLRRYSDDVVTVEKSEIPDDVLREMMGNNYEMQLESVKLGPELAKRGYNIWENGFHNNIMENFSVLEDAVAHHLADDLIPAKTMAEAYDITYQNGGTLDDAIRLAAEMSGTKLSNPTNAEGILLRGAAQADTPKVNMPKPENPIPDASKLPQGEQQTLDDILKLDTDNGGNVPPTNETDIPKPDMGGNPPDENPINLTQEALGDERERGLSRHIRNEDTPMGVKEVSDEVQADFKDNPDMYKTLRNADTQALANDIYNSGDSPITINGKAYTGNVETKFRSLLDEKNPASLPLGQQIAKDYSAAGNHEMAAQIYRDMGAALTDSGRFSQAAVLTMMKNDPLTALAYFEKELNGLNKAGAEKYGKKWHDFVLTDEEKALFDNIEPGDTEAIKKAYDTIGHRIEKEYPVTFWEKVLEFRRVAMLFNMRTIARNTLANPPTAMMRAVANRIEALGQHAAHIINPDIEITQSLIGAGKKERQMAKEVFAGDKVQAMLKNEAGRLSEIPKVGDYAKSKQIFKGGFVSDWINKWTDGGIEKLNAKMGKEGADSIGELWRNSAYKALEVTDAPMVKENFVARLGSYIRAKGITDISQIPDEAIQMAYEEAMKATYKDNSWLVNSLRNFKSGIANTGNNIKKGFGDVASQALIPYVQAPGNIGARIMDYSPVGAAKAINKIIDGSKGGDTKLIQQGIEELSKGLSGTSLAVLGIALYKSGILTGAYSSDADQKAFEKQHGFREFAIRYNVNGQTKYDTIDWAQPFVDTIMMGVLLAQAVDNSDQYDSDILRYFGHEGTTAGKVIGATREGARNSINYFVNATPLKSLGELFESRNGKPDVAQNLWSSTVENFATGLIPAQAKAIAKSTDPIQRQTYDPSNTFGTFVNSVKSGIPGKSDDLAPKYDTWGEPMTYGDSKAEAAFGKLLYPGEHTSDHSDAVDDEINRLFDTTGSNTVFPQVAPYSVGADKLNDRQVSDYQHDMGVRSRQLVEALMDSDVYKNLDDAKRVEALEDIYGLSKALTEQNLFDKPLADKYKAAAEALEGDNVEGLMDYLGNKHNIYDINADAYKKLVDAGEDLTQFEGYSDALEQYGLNDNATNREAWKENKEEGLQGVVDYNKAFTDAGMETAYDSATAHQAYDADELEQYKDYRDYIKEKEISDTEAHWEQFKKGQIGSVADEDKVDWSQYGLTYKFADEGYAKAKSALSRQLPSFNPEQYATMFKAIDGMEKANNGITQNELIKYFNAEDLPLSYGQAVWNAFGKTSGSNKWKKGPVYEDGEWKLKSL